MSKTKQGQAALIELLDFVHGNFVETRIVVNRIKFNISWVALLPLLGIPTHHSKAVAFQTPATPVFEGIVDLHHDIMFFLVFIMVFVLYLLAVLVVQFTYVGDSVDVHGYAGDDVTHSTPLEII
jgi:heme/copper-type cytochrome/quinol oxidase subunit 2